MGLSVRLWILHQPSGFSVNRVSLFHLQVVISRPMHVVSRTVLWTLGLFLYSMPYLCICLMSYGWRQDPDMGGLEHTVQLTWHCCTDILPRVVRGLAEPEHVGWSMVILTLVFGWFLVLSQVLRGSCAICYEVISKAPDALK